MSGKSTANLLMVGTIAGVALTVSQPAIAQGTEPAPSASPPSDAGDIIVTARKRSESLTRVPVAVSALGAADVNRYAAADLTKISQLAPQIIVTRGQVGGGMNLSIRGLGSGSGDQALEQTVSVNIDGVQVSRGRIASMGFFDLDQVEILKGPQALYFGKNSPAGVISLKSAGPTDTLSGYVRSGYEFVAREKFVEGAIAGPITDKLRARLALRGSQMDGWLFNGAQPGPNPADPRFPLSGASRSREPRSSGVIGRLTVDYRPDDTLTVVARVFGGRTNEGGPTNIIQGLCFTPVPTLNTSIYLNPGSECNLDRNTELGGLPQGFPTVGWRGFRGDPYLITKTILGSLSIDKDFGNVKLTSVTGYLDLDAKGEGNTSYGSAGLIYSTIGEHSKAFTQELRLNSDYSGPVNFTLGAYYAHNDMTGYVSALQLLRVTNPDPLTGQSYSFARETSARGTTLSGFGQMRWSPVPEVELATGIRYTHETKQAATSNTYVHPNFSAAFKAAGIVLSNNRTEDNWSPEATLTWHPTHDQTLYAAYKTGYKSGGISQPSVLSASFNTQNLLFQPEKTTGFEIGYKARLFDGKLRFDLTAYRYTVNNLQVVAFVSALTTSFLTNAGTARSQGIESSFTWRAADPLTLRGAIGYNKAQFLTFTNSPCYLAQTASEGCVGGVQDLSGRTLPRAPKVNFSLGATYVQSLGSDLQLTLDTDVTHSSSLIRQDNLNPLALQPAYTLLNASVRVGQTQGWELAVIGRNLTNEIYALNGVDFPSGAKGQLGVYTARPREVWVQASYKF